MKEIFGSVNWAALLGLVNLAAIATVLRIQSRMHARQVENLELLRQSEFVKEIKAYREHYEERRLVLEHQIKQQLSEHEEILREAKERAADAERELTQVVSSLNLKESEISLIRLALGSASHSSAAEALAIFALEIRTHVTVLLGYSNHMMEEYLPKGQRPKAKG